MTERRPLTGPQKFLIGGLVALTVVLVGITLAGAIISRRPPAVPSALVEASTRAIEWKTIKSERGVTLDDVFVAVIPKEASPDYIDQQSRAHCAGRQVCKIMGWVDQAAAATAFPMTEREFTTQSYSYDLNRQSGLDRGLFDCRIWRVEKPRCLVSAEE